MWWPPLVVFTVFLCACVCLCVFLCVTVNFVSVCQPVALSGMRTSPDPAEDLYPILLGTRIQEPELSLVL